MRVAVLEYLSGGGLDVTTSITTPPDKSFSELIAPLLGEGLSMLSALAMDLVSCGHEVHVCLAELAAAMEKGHDLLQYSSQLHVHRSNEDWMQSWTNAALLCDRTIVIAPEIEHELERIVAKLRAAGAHVVTSSELFLRVTSDKLATSQFMDAAQIRHPTTKIVAEASSRSAPSFPFDITTRAPTSSDSLCPVVLKRRDGAGCSDMKYFESQASLCRWLETIADANWQSEEWIIQPWQPGVAASLAIIANEEWHLVGAMSQNIRLEPQTSGNMAKSSGATSCSAVYYRGGTGPLDCVTKEQLGVWLARVRQALPPGAQGWIGVDFLVPPKDSDSTDLVLIEVNPRLTTSYLGYRQWYGHALADCLLGVRDPNWLSGIDYRSRDRIVFEAN